MNAQQEVLTFASLTDPAGPSGASECSPLFPVLRRRAAAYLANFAPEKAFRFSLAQPLGRGSAVSLAMAVVLGLAMMALVRPPTPEATQARQLREMAHAIERSSATDEGRALVSALRDTASALENPKLPPEQKLKMLAAVMNEADRIQPQGKPPEGNKIQSQSGKGSSAGSGNSGGTGEGAGSGQGRGSGKSNSGEPNGSGAGKKNEQQIAELKNELSKARRQIESEAAPKDNSMPKPAPGKKNSSAMTAGGNPNQPGSANQPNAVGRKTSPKPDQNAAQAEKTGEGGKQTANSDKGSTRGDTRLGQFPEPVRYERFYKPGEHGPPIDIHDARYVVFRLPSAAIAAGGGKTVADADRPGASAPYSNQPLKDEQLEAAPDERQQVPPRYRDLIR